MNLKESLVWFGLASIDGVTVAQLKPIYHKLAQKYHPDKGGSADDFIKLREAYSYLQEYIANPRSQSQSQQSEYRYEQAEDISDQLNRYKEAYENSQHKIRGYEDMITRQINLINTFQNTMKFNVDFAKQEDIRLRGILDEELAKLKKQYNSGWWKSAIGIKNMSDEQYTAQYNAYIDQFNKIKQDNDDKYIEDLLAIYRELLNQIVDAINTV
jgi:curved DNA-binding protein CbpA